MYFFVKYLVIVILSISILNKISLSKNIDLTPINFDLKGIEYKDDTFIVFGNFGSALASYDNLKTWHQLKIFEYGNIVHLFIDESKMAAFREDGLINISTNSGQDWIYAANINDSIVYVINTSFAHYLRTKSKIIKLNDKFEILSEFPITFNPQWRYDSDNAMQSRNSIIFYKGNLIAMSDSSMLIKFDSELIPVDSLSFKKLGICTDCQSSYNLYLDSNYIYARVFDGIYNGSLYKIEDFKNVEKVFHFDKNYTMFDSISPYPWYFNIINNKKISLNRFAKYENKIQSGPYYNIYEVINLDSAVKIGEIDCSVLPYSSFGNYLNHFTIANNKIIVAGDNKFLSILNLEDSKTIKTSSLSNISIFSDLEPDVITESTYLYYMKNGIYKTNDDGITFRQIKPDKNLKDFQSVNDYFNIKKKLFDVQSGMLYLFGYYSTPSSPYILVSDDFGNSFDSLKLDYFNFSSSTTNIQWNDNNFIFGFGYYYNKTDYSIINTYSKDFKLISSFRDSSYRTEFVQSADTNSFLVLGSSTGMFSTTDLKFTTDKGMNWGIIKKYYFSIDTLWDNDSLDYFIVITSDLLNYKEVKIHHKHYWVLLSYRRDDSIFSIDLLDIENKKLDSVYIRKIFSGQDNIYTAIDFLYDTVLIAIDDTIFYADDLYDYSKWSKILLPDNGKILGKLKKFENKLFALYTDDLHPVNLYWLRISDTTTNVVEKKNETIDYLYAYPPYPIPAKSEVFSTIYWDTGKDIDKARINVYNIYGEIVAVNSNITIEKQTNYKGTLIWDCSNLPNGIYLMHIKHSSASVLLKVMINR